ncbi:hypothetical protein R3I93_012361 [Phoxinus phoxinus]|uniref:AIG1-type G domain-containing protein n=1 Tax=Phoxinus phoxinus TaxID=58324 RepID=A0AAN9CU43_9TELE
MENRSQVTKLLEKIEKMVEANGGEHYTNEMFQEAQSRILDRAQFWSGKPRIVLLGKAGSGKSSTRKIIEGRESSEWRSSPYSATETCELHEAHVGGKSMRIIDTPGLIDASEEKMKDTRKKFVIMCDPGPHVFLLVIRLDTRFTDEEKNTKKWIQKNIGEKALRHTIILFTDTDHLKDKSIDQYIDERGFLRSLVDSCGGRFISSSNQENQVTELLEKIENMAEGNGWRYYTNEMFQEIIKEAIVYEKMKAVVVDIAAKAGTGAGAGVMIAGGVVLGVTEMVFLPALLIVGGGVALASAVVAWKLLKKHD